MLFGASTLALVYSHNALPASSLHMFCYHGASAHVAPTPCAAHVAESMLRLLCYVFGVETATVALLTGEAIYITGACGALPVCVCPDRCVTTASHISLSHTLDGRVATHGVNKY
jgi:hypothetical protein